MARRGRSASPPPIRRRWVEKRFVLHIGNTYREISQIKIIFKIIIKILRSNYCFSNLECSRRKMIYSLYNILNITLNIRNWMKKFITMRNREFHYFSLLLRTLSLFCDVFKWISRNYFYFFNSFVFIR